MPVIFRTPGHIDPRAFTTFGMSAKPESRNPIGFFGTGLKYAIATLVRKGAKLTIWIGQDRYEFFTEATEFRGQAFSLVRMRKLRRGLRRAQIFNLPFTTEHGKNWETWQALRELEANTRDENGTSWQADSAPEPNTISTIIIVDLPEFTEAYEKLSDIFLTRSDEPIIPSDVVSIYPGRSKFLYYRGLRVATLEKPTLHTYNFHCQLKLTEDRTLEFPFQARTALASTLVTCDNAALIEDVVNADDDAWEGNIEWDYQYATPSEAAKAVFERNRPRLNNSARRYYSFHVPEIKEADPFENFPRPWVFDVEDNSVRDKENTIILWPEDSFRDIGLKEMLRIINTLKKD